MFFHVGFDYVSGDGQDYELAHSLFVNDKENPEALAGVALCYLTGIGCKINVKQGMELMHKAEREGSACARILLVRHSDDHRTKENAALLQLYADKGFAVAQFALAGCYVEGIGVSEALIAKDPSRGVEYAKRAVDQNYAPAFTMLGKCYECGMGIEADKTAALFCYRKAAALNCASGYVHLARVYDKGLLGEVDDDDKAREYLIKALDQDHPEAQVRYGRWLETGARGTPVDGQQALKMFTKAADQGSALAQCILATKHKDGKSGFHASPKLAFELYMQAYNNSIIPSPIGAVGLADCYFYGIHVKQDMATAVDYYRKAAEKEFDVAQHALGQCFEKGNGVKKDLAVAFKWYSKAAAEGYPPAQTDLARMYNHGLGVAVDHREAQILLEKAAASKFPKAFVDLAYMHDHGTANNGKDYKTAFELFSRGAELGHAVGQYNLSIYYREGFGVTADPEKMKYWLRKAAQHGHAQSQYELAMMYIQGRYDIPQDLSAGIELLKKACEKKLPRALTELGFCFERGIGVKRNPVQAALYYAKGAEAGDRWGMYNLAWCLRAGFGVSHSPSNLVKSFQLCKASAILDFPVAAEALGHYYMNGIGVEVDELAALESWNNAVSLGSVKAMYTLAKQLRAGTVMFDPVRALLLTAQAAVKGHSDCAYDLAQHYWNAHRVEIDEQDDAVAFALLRIASDSMLDRKQLQLNDSMVKQMFCMGISVGPPQPTNHMRAQIQLSQCYEYGIGTVKDLREAAYWCEQGQLSYGVNHRNYWRPFYGIVFCGALCMFGFVTTTPAMKQHLYTHRKPLILNSLSIAVSYLLTRIQIEWM